MIDVPPDLAFQPPLPSPSGSGVGPVGGKEKEGTNQIAPKPEHHLLAGCSTAEEVGKVPSDRREETGIRVEKKPFIGLVVAF